jgi:5'-methylthioadenosine phosphorylase
MTTEKIDMAVIGGSGLYDLEGLTDKKEVNVDTPFGKPSDAIITGTIAGVKVGFLARHGRGHKFLPGELPQRANIYALKKLGAKTVIAVSAVGSLKEEYRPKDFVFPDQLVDNSKGRVSTFFGDGVVAHVQFAYPFCNCLSKILYKESEKLGIPSHRGGTLVCMEGPLFSTKAESHFHRKMGYSLIGMTASPEAKLAREAQMCYAPVSCVTDYDVWKEGEEVSSDLVMETISHNVKNAKRLLVSAIPEIAKHPKTCACNKALENSIVTRKTKDNEKTFEKLKVVFEN